MGDKKVISSKMGGRTVERLENYAEKEEISRSQATERMCKQGLDVEESDMRLIPVRSDGGTMIEEKLETQQQELQKQSQELQKQQRRAELQTGLTTLTVIGLFFIAGELLIGLPGWFVVSVGILLVFGLLGGIWAVKGDD